MAVGCNPGMYDYIRTDNKDHPGVIITRYEEYVGIRTHRHSPYGTRTTRESGRGKFGGKRRKPPHFHLPSLSLSLSFSPPAAQSPPIRVRVSGSVSGSGW